MAEGLPGPGPVDGGGLGQVPGDVLDAGDVNNHHVADHLPVHHRHQPPEAVPGGEGDVHPQKAGQDAVDNQLPDVAQDDAPDEVGHEKDGAEKVPPRDGPGEEQGQGEGEKVHCHHRNHRELQGEPQGVQEIPVPGEGGDVVLHPHELGVGDGGELAEGEPHPHDKGNEEGHHKGRQGGQDEDGEVFFQSFFHNGSFRVRERRFSMALASAPLCFVRELRFLNR